MMDINKIKEKLKDLETLVAEYEKQNELVSLDTLWPGEVFAIGEHDFVVLEQRPGQTAVISKWFMASGKPFDDNSTDYNKSSLKELIESEIQPIIEETVGADNLVEHEVDLTSIDMQRQYANCKCKVRPITFDETRKYNDLLVNNDLNDWWWTCTPWSTAERGWKYSIAVVSPSGGVGNDNCRNDDGVRPFCILKSNIKVRRKIFK